MADLFRLRAGAARGGLIAASLLLISAGGRGQETPCTIDVPANVMIQDGTLVRRLNADAFVARSKHESVQIQSLTNESGPRRILFVVETGKQVREPARKIEESIIAHTLSNARSQDSFALLTACGPRKELRFGSGTDELKAAAKELGTPARDKSHSESIMDALLEAGDWFQPQRPGDSIIMITMGIEGDPGASYSKVKSALIAGGIRLFGFQLGQPISGYYSVGVSVAPDGASVPSASISPNRESVFALARETGGVVFLENTAGGPRWEYKLTNERFEQVDHLAQQVYKAVTEYYAIQVRPPSKDFVLDLADPLRAQIPRATVLYPRRLPVCSPPGK